MQRTVQEIFDLAIEKDYYEWSNRRKSYMCVVLSKMRSAGIISYGEYFRAKYAIQKYIRELNFYSDSPSNGALTLQYALIGAGFNYTRLVQFYRKWDNRPKPQELPWYGKLFLSMNSFFATICD